jgi:hypothetical protein
VIESLQNFLNRIEEKCTHRLSISIDHSLTNQSSYFIICLCSMSLLFDFYIKHNYFWKMQYFIMNIHFYRKTFFSLKLNIKSTDIKSLIESFFHISFIIKLDRFLVVLYKQVGLILWIRWPFSERVTFILN